MDHSADKNNINSMETTSSDLVRRVLRKRPSDMHKGHAGRVLIIAGQVGMAGAAVLSARGTLYSGAGLVKISAPEEIFDILQISVPEAMCIGRKGFASGSAGYDWSAYDAIAIGPGLGTGREQTALLRKVLGEFDGPVIIDADGLNCLCTDLSMLQSRTAVTVITPHPGEADRLLKAAGLPGYDKQDREGTAQRLLELMEREGSGQGESIVLLKGEGTLILASPEDGAQPKGYVNATGNPGMATGGSGDVLTGVIVSLLAQVHAGAKANAREKTERFMNATYVEAVACAAYLHGLAGDLAAANIGQYGMTSADIADAISSAINEVTGF